MSESFPASVDELLDLYCYILFQYDNTKHWIDYVILDKTVVARNLSVSDFFDFLINQENLIPAEKEKIISVLNQQKETSIPSYVFTIECLTCNGKTTKLAFKGKKYTDKVITSINSVPKELTFSITDNLTKALTSNAIFSQIQNVFSTESEPFILLKINIDDFNTLNVSYGSVFADLILVEVAAAIRSIVADKGSVGRIGGDVFLAIIYTPIDYETIWELCNKIKRAIEALSSANSKGVAVTATIGCTIYPTHGTNLNEHLEKLKKAISRGKSIGKNRFIIYTEEKCGNIENVYTNDLINVSNDYFDPEMQIISSIFDLMNRYLPITKNIEDSLELVGNFFTLDRITFNVLNETHDQIYFQFHWVNPALRNIEPIKPDINGVYKVAEQVNKNGYYCCSYVPDSEETLDEMLLFLKKHKTKSTLIFVLKNSSDELTGTLRFDICTSHHIWKTSELHYLSLISKIFASSIHNFITDNQLERKLYTDELTGLFNQSKFISTAGAALLEDNTPSALLVFNISHFRYINEQYGYEEGNKILVYLSELIKEYLPQDSLYSRGVGDRFYTLVKTQNREEIQDIFKQISSLLRMAKHDSFVRKVVLNAGVYMFEPEDTVYKGIDMATLAIQSIADSEKPSISFYDEDFCERIALQKEIEEHMFTALKNNEFEIFYQPKVDINTEQIIGAEALTRWNFKHKKFLQPYQFINIFEKNGFIVELDFYVFDKVCSFLSNLIKNKKTIYPISINMSRYHFNFTHYLERIEAIRNKYELDSKYIEIEITEGITNNTTLISDFIEKLHSLGYRVSMDDFGSGYSNLAALSNLDFDTIKLDKCLCSDSFTPKESIIVANVIKMAYELNMTVLCEGVETREQADILSRLGCNHAQGWLYDKALPQVEFIEKYIK